MPARIKRERTAGWRKGDAVIVDRTSRFGNPFVVREDHLGIFIEHPDGAVMTGFASETDAREVAVGHHRAWLDGDGPDAYRVRGRVYDRRRVLADLPLLRGRDLACPCDLPEPGEADHCHARVLIEISNRP